MQEEKERIKKVVMLFSMSFLSHQGRYLRVYNEARTLVEADMDVTIIAWDRDCELPREETIDGIKIERILSRAGFQRGPSHVFSFLVYYFRLLKKLLRKDADVIHCFNLDTIIPGLFTAWIKGSKTVLDLCEPSYYTNWSRKYRILINLLQLFERILSRRFDYLLVHNLFQVRKFRNYKVKAIEQIGSYPNRSLVVNKVNIKKRGDGAVVIGRFGSIYKNNGIEEMIDAFKRLKPCFPNVKLLLAGKVFEEFREEFNNLVSPFGDAIEIRGGFSPKDLPGLYRETDISLQLTRRTDWFKNITPTKFFESLANGVLVVTSDIGGLKEIIDEYQCGLIVTSPESVYSALERLLEDFDLRLKMAKNGLRAVNEKYSWDLMRPKLLRIYQTLESTTIQRRSSAQIEASQC